MDIYGSLSSLPKINEKNRVAFNKLGIFTVFDVLYHFPYRYLDPATFKKIKDLNDGDEVIIAGRVTRTHLQRFRGRRTVLITVTIEDDTGTLDAVYFNQNYILRILKPGTEVCLRGKIEKTSRFGVQIKQPLMDVIRAGEADQEPHLNTTHTRYIVPIHRASAAISPNQMRRHIGNALKLFGNLPEVLPRSVLLKRDLPLREEAINEIHFPSTVAQGYKARKRFLYEELFLLQVALALRKRYFQVQAKGVAHDTGSRLLERFIEILPFDLTNDQHAVIDEIIQDMALPHPMNRLLQGEVGSGKTVVAFAACLVAADSGHQAAIMAPTEILAQQHYNKMVGWAEALGIKVSLLKGSTPKKERDMINYNAERGLVDIVIGTHALIQQNVEFKKLSLIVIDEQHRFGVRQRMRLKEKGYEPDVLLMTATPIPRTVSLTFYGDLDISTIRELPGGRNIFDHVETFILSEDKRDKAYQAIRLEVAKGRQAYIVCPLVEPINAPTGDEGDLISGSNASRTGSSSSSSGESFLIPAADRAKEGSEIMSATADEILGVFDEDEYFKKAIKAVTHEAKRLKEDIFPDLRVEYLHGKMKPAQKERIMSEFLAGDLDILIASTVIEVGVDVPNATVMLIENADRFGLSQLHQLRGRIGRGAHKGICLLFSDLSTDDAKKRLKAIKEIKDGFELAEADLEIRGEGQLFGEKQSGMPDLRLAKLVRDIKILKIARTDAFELVDADPTLSLAEHQSLYSEIKRLYAKNLDWLFQS